MQTSMAIIPLTFNTLHNSFAVVHLKDDEESVTERARALEKIFN